MMSPEEWQVAVGEWVRMLGAASDELWDMDKDKLDDDTHDVVLKVANVLGKTLRDMGALQWSESDRDHAFTVIAGYVTQSNVERQARRDADLARHKAMVDKDAEKRIIEGIREADARARASEQERIALLRSVDLTRGRMEAEFNERTAALDAQFEKRVADEVQRRLLGDAVAAAPGRKRPLVIG